MGTHQNLFGNVMGTHITPHPQPLKKRKVRGLKCLLHAISIFKIISHILNTSYLPKLGIVTQWGEKRWLQFCTKIFFSKIPLRVIEGKKIVLNHKPIHLPCKIKKKKLDSHHKRCDYQ
jgi:hypothetical protein